MLADAQHFADLGQGQAQCLGRAHEPQPGDRVLVVGAVPARGAVWGREEPGVLVEPDGSHRYGGSGGELAAAPPGRAVGGGDGWAPPPGGGFTVGAKGGRPARAPAPARWRV